MDKNSTTEGMCDLCGSKRASSVCQIPSFQVQRCSQCGLIWRSPKPTTFDLHDVYGHGSFEAQFQNQKELYRQKRGRSQKRLLDGIVSVHGGSSGNLLDIGCAYGWFLSAALERGFTVHGIEPLPALAEVAAQTVQGTIHHGFFEDTELPEESFDAITMLDVLEHTGSPRVFLNRAANLLRPGGVLVLQIPDVTGLMIRTCLWLYRFTFGFYWRPMWLLYRYHTYGFCLNTIERYLKEQNLDIVFHYGEQSKDLSTLAQKPWARSPLTRAGVHLVVHVANTLNMPDELIVFAQKT